MAMIALSWGCAATPPCSVPEEQATSLASIDPSNAALQQKVKAQEKRINELSMQLNLLKRIDQDRQRLR
jgi:hypothetical protein